MIKEVYICDHCKKRYEDGGTLIYYGTEQVGNLCGECGITYMCMCNNQEKIRHEFINPDSKRSRYDFDCICGPDGDIAFPSDIKYALKRIFYEKFTDKCKQNGSLTAEDIEEVFSEVDEKQKILSW